MSVLLRSGGHRIVASGEAFVFGPDAELSIDVNEENLQLKLKMCFSKSQSCGASVNYDVRDGRLFMFCDNFGPETGPIEPQLIQNVNGQKFYVMFRYFETDYDGRVKSVKYTIFIEEENR